MRFRPSFRVLLVAACAVFAAPAGTGSARQPVGPPEGTRALDVVEPARHRADGDLSEWRGKPTGLSGQSVTSLGELIHTDWLYDDHGPDLDGIVGMPQFRSVLAPVRGDYVYPDRPDRYGYNAADLRELRIAADRRALHLAISLQTMKVADAAIVMVALDGDRSEETSVPEWPDGAGIRTRGPERFITAWGTGARLTTPKGSAPLRTAVNLRENAIEVSVSHRALGTTEKKVRAWVVTGLNDGRGRFREQEPGATAVFNAGFRAEEEFPRFDGAWSENRQATILARADVSDFARTVNLSRLRRGRSDRPRPPRPGYYNRVFRSRLDYGEGIVPKTGVTGDGEGNPAGTADPMFLSPHQPYSLYVPRGYDPGRRHPLTLIGHSLDVNHNMYRVDGPRSLRQLGDERGALLITPLARGTDTWYLDSGLVDVLEAWDDVRANYAVDDERTSITGYSMGGYMTYRLGLLMPDRFARASVYVGPPAYYFWPYPLELQSSPEWEVPGNTNRIVENARNLPYEIVHGNADELVPVAGVQHQADTFREKGNPYRFFRHSGDDHFSFIVNDEWARTRDWLGDFARERNPGEVVYKRYPSMDLPGRGLVFDGAYWVDGIAVRDAGEPADFGLVEATSFALAGNGGRARELAPEAVPGPTTPGTLTGQVREPGEPIAGSNGFEARLTNVSGLRFLVERMGLDTRRPIAVRVESDGPTRIALHGRFPEVGVRVGDRAIPADRTSRRRVRFSLPGGTSEVTVAPR